MPVQVRLWAHRYHKEPIIRFDELSLHPTILQAIVSEGYTTPTPIQIQAIPPVTKGRDLLGIAQTGTGKTAAFALPILHRLAADPHGRRPGTTRVLVLVPTRELAIQVRESFDRYGARLNLHSTCIFGGVSASSQKEAMARGVDILVATPGRLLDLLGQRALTLKTLSILVLDEADRMLDMGFINDIRKIIAQLPPVRQNLFFSATMPSDIAKLAANILRNPIRIEVTPSATPIEVITQIVYPVDSRDKQQLLKSLLQNKTITRALVFTRTKHGANKVCEGLIRNGISAAAIHGNKSQNRRQEALAGFQTGAIRILVATDIAARGIDVDEVSHVFNFDIPEVAETYVHRIGRTARAGASGSAISFCAPDEQKDLMAIDRLIRRKVPRGDATELLKSKVVRPNSIDSPAGRFDKDLRTYIPGASPHKKNNQSRHRKKEPRPTAYAFRGRGPR
ncbi:MAG: DEAD/DEAH box helicase [Chitinispirillaceae bacterium]|nr:DEAD/DEAH box helicase [Chitinispirillaceae bacterium]